ncbi:MAG: glycosyltransferase family 4 protein [Gammaproteobacteria bacterium]|nr:glycosyltransferase family 4 protein [Gammaproteobacteria bacterium]
MFGARVLISTITPISGGVPQMTRFVIDCLEERGYRPVLGYYQPYSMTPELSVPSFQLLRKRMGFRVEKIWNEYEAHAMGAWLPELEFTHYWPTRPWKALMDSCDYHVSVSGNCLAGLPFALSDRPYLAWVASSWHGDRKDRVRFFPWPRRLLDRLINAQVISRLERKILSRGTIIALSQYTRSELNALSRADVTQAVMPMPVDEPSFVSDPERVIRGRIGFVGRFNDPRKNIGLLLEAVAACRQRGLPITAELVGDQQIAPLQVRLGSLGLKDAVTCIPLLDHEQLAQHLQSYDVFVVPSHQEGLCIAALEAMACGCPVISTRCGGPEEFVRDGKTGFLVDDQPNKLADAIARVVLDRGLRSILAEGACRLISERYSLATVKQQFWNAFEQAFQPHYP